MRQRDVRATAKGVRWHAYLGHAIPGCRWALPLGPTFAFQEIGLGLLPTQATGRSSCSAVSSCPVVPSGRGVLGWVFSAAVLTRTSWNSVAIGDLFGCKMYKCVQVCTAKAIFFRPSGSVNPPSTAKAASESQASGRRVSIVGAQISLRDPGPNPPARGLDSWQSMPPDCTAAVVVSGSHTCRRVASLVRPKTLAAGAPVC